MQDLEPDCLRHFGKHRNLTFVASVEVLLSKFNHLKYSGAHKKMKNETPQGLEKARRAWETPEKLSLLGNLKHLFVSAPWKEAREDHEKGWIQCVQIVGFEPQSFNDQSGLNVCEQAQWNWH